MKVLIISFDKTLSEKLKEALSQKHEVFTAKNTEEALTLIPHEIDVIVFDAISGAISEEEINQLYNKKFSRQKYIVLYDELFPVDENNLQPPDKVLIIRDKALEEVPKLVEESTPADVSSAPSGEPETATALEEHPQEPTTPGKPKVLIVSFDKKLTDELESLLKDKYETEVVKNQRLVKEKGKNASLIVFDAISGTIAEKNLMELAEDPVLREKPYLILMDDLFPINVEKLDLPKKKVVNRDAPATLIAEQIDSLLMNIQRPKAEPQVEEAKAEESKAEEEPIQERPSEIEEKSQVAVEESTSGEEKAITQEPYKEYLEELATSQTSQLQASHHQTYQPVAGNVNLSLDEKTIKAAIVEAISRELAGLREEVKMEVSGYIRDVIESVVREEVEKYLLELKIGELIREETKKIVEEKLKELLS
ncbi:response regulator [Aquifex sp.]